MYTNKLLLFMFNMFNFLKSHSTQSDLIVSFGLFLFVFLLYFSIKFFISRTTLSFFEKKSISVKIRNIFIFIFILGLISIWSGQLKTVFISAAAIAAAAIVALKELILSFVGYFVISANNIFDIGDEIEYESIRGKVIDKNFTTIKLQIVDKHDNKIIFIPNLLFFSNKVTNLSKIKEKKFHHFTINLDSHLLISYFKPCIENKLAEFMNFNKEEYNNTEYDANDYFEPQKPDNNFYLKINLMENKENKIIVYFFASNKTDKKKIEKFILETYLEFIKSFNLEKEQKK